VAALIKKTTGLEPEIVPGDRGEFTIWVGGEHVAGKDSRGFPAEDDVLAAVHDILRGVKTGQA